MRILIATGGTGGHIYPALALADAARSRYEDCEILFVGNKNRMESKEIPQHGYRFIGLEASGLSGNILNKLKALGQMSTSYVKALKIVKDFKPDIAIGFGGYVSAPVMMAAHTRKVKTMLHEQNSIVGKANKLCMKFADAIVICYEKCFDECDRSKTRLLGNPRASIVKKHPFDQDVGVSVSSCAAVYSHHFHSKTHLSIFFIILAGTPATTVYGKTSFVTTLPAPITDHSPTVTPDNIVEFEPTHTFRSSFIGA